MEHVEIVEIKKRIESLINDNYCTEAIEFLKDLLLVFPDDLDIYSMYAVALSILGDFEKAISICNAGLNIDLNNFDLNYNLAYVYENIGEYSKALTFYKIAIKKCIDENLRKDIENIIDNIQCDKKYEQQKKIVFFVKSGMDSFLEDIINGLLDDYVVKKIIVNNLNEIDRGMEWADICWFEWCDELIEYGSKHRLAESKKVICRLHSYEAFDLDLNNIDWNNIDKIIFVSQKIKSVVLERYNIDNKKAVFIPNGININKYKYSNRSKGFNLAYVGYINYKKGPMLLLHTFKAVYDIDKRYKLYIAGEFQDYRDYMYFQQMIKELGMEENIIFEGWQDSLDNWLEDKNYILCTSLLESQNISIMQAMSKGIKPIIHNFVGARDIYDADYIWNTIDEAVNMILDKEYNSKGYLEFIKRNYFIENKIINIKELIKSLFNSNKNDFNYKEYWNSRLDSKFDIEGVGYIGLGEIYNRFLYESRFELLDYIVKNTFENIDRMSVLELGPGIGMFTDYFYKNNIKNYVAIDISEKSKEELSKKYKGFNFILGDISEEKNYPNSKFSLIFAADVLLHLTDEKRYMDLIRILSNSLADDGVIIIFDPITTINSKSQSPHLVIRDVKYIKDILKHNELELVEMIPSTFFMNYPFDSNILEERSIVVEDMFNLIQAVFSSVYISDVVKEKLGEWISLRDKECLARNKFGLSQKVLVIKKKSNEINNNLKINDIWNLDKIRIRADKLKYDLMENDEVIKYNLIDLFERSIEEISKMKNTNKYI